MLQTIFASALIAASTVLGCADHSFEYIKARSEGLHSRALATTEWAYDASYDWGRINPNYTLCQAGSMQSPIPLLLTQGMSLNHVPTFNFSRNITGYVYNWGYGPAFTVNHTAAGGITNAPSFKFDNTTGYLKGWHIHAPADHSVQGQRSKAELHLVMADANAKELAVLAIRIDPGNMNIFSPFLSQFSGITPSFNDSTTVPSTMSVAAALSEAGNFGEFWTYRGSLTSPPCTEGIRFFVARNVLFASVQQMQQILAVSTFSARVEQQVWQHQINV